MGGSLNRGGEDNLSLNRGEALYRHKPLSRRTFKADIPVNERCPLPTTTVDLYPFLSKEVSFHERYFRIQRQMAGDSLCPVSLNSYLYQTGWHLSHLPLFYSEGLCLSLSRYPDSFPRFQASSPRFFHSPALCHNFRLENVL